jgi:TP901 family phage tail tape measure protein
VNDLNVSVIMRLVNKLRGPAREAQGDLQRIEAQTERLEKRTGGAARAQVLMGQAGRVAMRGVAIGAGAATLAAGNSIRQAIKMEDAWSDANKTLELSPVALAQMKDQVDAMATRIPIAREGLVDIVATAGQLGIRGSADIMAFTEDAAKMAETFDVAAGNAAGMMGSWREQMGYSQDEVRLLADQINYLGNTTAANSAQLAAYTTGIVGIADEAGLTEEAMLALGAAMIASGRAPEVAVTGMRALFRTMTSGADQMTKAQSDVLGSIGLMRDWNDIQLQMQTDSEGAILRVVTALSSLSEEQRTAAAGDLFGEEAARALGPMLTNVEKLEGALDRIPEIAAAAGSMNAEYLALSEDVADNWKRVKNALAARSEGFGETMLDPINAGLKGTLELLASLDERANVFERIGTGWQGFASGFSSGGGNEIAETLGRISGAIGDFILGVEGQDPGEVLARVFVRAKEMGERAGAVRDAVVTAYAPIIEQFKSLQTAAGALLNGDFANAQSMISDFFDWLGTAEIPRLDYKAIYEQLLPTEVMDMPAVQSFISLTQSVFDALHGIATFVKNTGAAFLGGWLDGFSASIDPAMKRLSATYDQLQPIVDNFTRIFTALGSLFSGAAEDDGVTSWFASFGELIGAISGTAFEILATVLEGIARAIVAVTGAVASALDGDFAGAADSLRAFFTWLGDLLLPEWLDDFSLGDYFAGAFDFEWIDMLPSWEWGDIIPDMPSFSMPDFGGLFGGDGPDDVDVPDVPTKTPDLPTIKEVRADTGKVEVLQAKITAVMSDAQELPGVVEAAIRQAEQAATLDLTSAGVDMMQSLATGIRSGTAEVVAAVSAMADQVRRAMPTAPAVKLVAGAQPKVQARAVGGSFGPGFLLTGERGPELEYRTHGGFIAHHGQLQEMIRRTDAIRRNVQSARGGALGGQAQLQKMITRSDAIRRTVGRSAPAGVIAAQAAPPAAGDMIVGDIHIHPPAGADPAAIAREVRRELKRLTDAKRGNLHDGEMYG